jgi:uncharacterized protein YndB with AHSA1/START domain
MEAKKTITVQAVVNSPVELVWNSTQNPRQVEVIFTAKDDNDARTTKIDITFDAESTFTIEMQRDGWQAILNNFKKYVETRN